MSRQSWPRDPAASSPQASAADARAILWAIDDAIIAVDGSLNLLLANPGALRLFKLPGEPLVGAPVAETFPDPGLLDLLSQTARTGETCRARVEIALMAGEPGAVRACQVTVAPIRSAGGENCGAVALLRDSAIQEEPERARGEFLSLIAHELKTPLHSMSGFLEILLDEKAGPLTDLQRDFLGTVKEQTGRVQALIRDLFEFGRMESGRFALRPGKVDLAALAARVVAGLHPLARAAALTLIDEVRAPLFVEADPLRVEQVLVNLCENAIRFSPEGGRVTIGATDRGHEIEVYVSDSGTGIRPEDLARIFEPYYQATGAVRCREGSAGLGLAVCKRIVEQHGGRIWAESRPGGGATFYFTLPKQPSSREDRCR